LTTTIIQNAGVLLTIGKLPLAVQKSDSS